MKTIITILSLLLIVTQIIAEGDEQEKRLSKKNSNIHYSVFNINNISTFIYANGIVDHFPDGNSGFEFPKGSGKYAIYQSGLVFGAKVNGEVRVGGSTYRTGLVPGAIKEDGTPEDSSGHTRVYRVFHKLDHKDNNDNEIKLDLTIDEALEQNKLDWQEWPADKGAPYFDVDSNGLYNPQIDIPGVPGSYQTLWFVANDFDENQSEYLYGSLPLGVEIQVTIWGYDVPGPIGNTMFKKYKVINKSSNKFEEMYFSIWADPDLGDAGDDYVGVDSTLSMAFAFNGLESDGVYGDLPPAIGFKIVQGPLVKGNVNDEAIFNYQIKKRVKNLKATSHFFFVGSDPIFSDPNLASYKNGTLEFYNIMRGRISATNEPFIDPITEYTTMFCLAGDPIAQTGWLDGFYHPPGDRRQVLTTGPFNMAIGDTQEIVIATIAAIGKNNLNAVANLKQSAKTVQNSFRYMLSKYFSLSGFSEFEIEIPKPKLPYSYSLKQNYPNPFNPNTTIEFTLPFSQDPKFESAKTKLVVYDVLGRKLKTLINKYLEPGEYSVEFNANNLPSGVYFYRLESWIYSETKKMILLR